MEVPNTHPPDSPAGYGPGPDDKIEIRELLRRLWGYKWLLTAVFFLVMGSAWVVLQELTPRYTATAVLLIAPPEMNVVDIDAVVEGLDTRADTVRGEIIVMRSRGLAAKAVEKLDLYNSPQLKSRSKKRSLFSHLNPLNYLPEDWSAGIGEFWRDAKASILGEPPPAILSEDERERLRRKATIDRFLAGLTVESVPLTRVVNASFTSVNPKLAADAANTLADVYVRSTLEVKYAGTREAALWLSDQVEELRQKVEKSEAAAERVRQGEALVQGRSAKLVSEQISAANAQLVEAKAETARLRARMRQIEKLRQLPDWEDQSSAVLVSDLIQALRLEQFKLEREAAELSTEYGEKHPKMINIRAEVADVEGTILREIEKFVAAAHNELVVAQARENALKQILDRLTKAVGGLNKAEMRLRALEREAKANSKLYDTFLIRYNETTIQEELQQPDARVISYAEVPNAPSYPPKRKILIGSFVMAIGLGLALVIVIETLDKGFRTARQLEQQTGVLLFGLLPSVPLGRGNVALLSDYIVQEPHSRYSEAINMIYSNIKWSWDKQTVKSVLISSALPQEGKTSTAAALARRAALAGENSLLIDCDFRHPQASKQLGLKASPGITEILSGEATLEEAIQEDSASGAKFLSCGRRIKDPVALLRSDSFMQLMERLKESYSFIVLDSSPILAVAEPQILARVVDQSLVLVRWGKTPRQAALAAIKQLQDFGAPVGGVVLTQVDLRKQSYYGYGEYGYYTSQMKGYYTR